MDFKIMKKIVFGLLMTMGVLNAQNNLVFNRVLEMYLTSSVSATVPQGKVWKVENAGVNISVTKPNVDYGLPMNQMLFQAVAKITWFSENTVIKSATSQPLTLSVLEFNVVPTSTGTGTGGGGVSSDGLVFSQMINEAITTQETQTSGTVIYSFQVPNGHVWKIKYLKNDYWNSNTNEFQGSLIGGAIYITTNDEGPFIRQGPAVSSTNDYAILLKEGNYQVKYFHANSSGGSGSGNRLYIEAIEYRIP
jgi:hypothetical protein